MISQDDYNFIIAFDKARDKKARDAILETQANQCSKTFLSLLGHISKDQTLQYILIMIDEMLQVNIIITNFWNQYSYYLFKIECIKV